MQVHLLTRSSIAGGELMQIGCMEEPTPTEPQTFHVKGPWDNA